MRLSKITSLSLAATLGLGLVAFAALSKPRQGSPSVAAGPAVDTGNGYSVRLPEAFAQGDGVRAHAHVGVSTALVDPVSGEGVRCVSYSFIFEGASGKKLSSLSGQEVVAADSSESITLTVSGIDPTVDALGEATFPGATPHSYLIFIAPALTTNWGSASSTEVSVDISRTE